MRNAYYNGDCALGKSLFVSVELVTTIILVSYVDLVSVCYAAPRFILN